MPLGSGNGRYWAKSVEPLALAAADGEGAFDIAMELESEDRIVLMALSSDGRISEFSQARRPVVFAPGIGGTWLQDANNDYLWLPASATSSGKNNRLKRLGMQPDGITSIENIKAAEVLEFAGLALYGPIHKQLDDAGYVGDKLNSEPAELDQWRFPNDWRLSGARLGDDLRVLVDQVTTSSGQTQNSAARSCQVDLVSHSNGGVIASTYLQANAEHASNHIHRFVASGTPYLGADQAYAAHANGYIFGADEKLPSLSLIDPFYLGEWDVAWGDMLEMTGNVPGAYGLLPSRAYFEAMNESTPTYLHGYGIVDLYNIPIDGFDDTVDFLTRKKLDDLNIPSGLGRNGDIWQDQQDSVHDLIDDWRAYEGPPHIFRHAGVLTAQTEVGWFMGPGPEYLTEVETSRSVQGDTDRHRAYRERLRAIWGLGDKTVPLLSASLGRHEDVGSLDLSGVDESHWIEEFEYYACEHGKLVEADCRPANSTNDPAPDALDRIIEILSSGSVVPTPASNNNAAKRNAGQIVENGNMSSESAEVLYVMSTTPVAVLLTDASGRHTGSQEILRLGEVSYEIPGIAFQASRLGATFTLPTDSSYTVKVTSVDPSSSITLIRQMATNETRSQVIYPTQALGSGGTLTLELTAGGTPPDAAWVQDVDGDGTQDGSIAPAAILDGTGAVPALPIPQPVAFEVTTSSNTENQTATLAIPNTGSEGWTFALSEDSPWLSLSTTSGDAPATIILNFNPADLPDGPVTTTISLTLANSAYEFATSIPVSFYIGVNTSVEEDDSLPSNLALTVAPNPVNIQTTVRFGLAEETDVTLTMYDMLGRQVAELHRGRQTPGAHAIPVNVAILPSGVYFVRLIANGTVQTKRFTVAR